MTFLAKQRSIQGFYDKIERKSESYKKGVRRTLENNFGKFCKEHFEKSMEDVVLEMKQADEEAVFDTIQGWINWVDKPSSIRTYFSRLKAYLYYRGIKITDMDVKYNLAFGQKPEEEYYPIKVEQLTEILSVASYKNKALYLLMESSGMRPVEAANIKKKDIEIGKERLVFHVPAKFTKLKRAKTTYCTKEAQAVLMPIINKIEDDDTLFGTTKTATVDTLFLRYCGKVGLDQRNGKGRNKINPMSLRAFFITKISRHDPNLAKKLAGQKGYLLSYDRLDDDDLLELYVKYDSDLIIDQTQKLKAENKKLEGEKSEIESDYADSISNMGDRILNLELEIKKIKNTH